MPNRKNRDQIISEALDMTDSQTLEQKERPDGTNITGTLSVKWLQNYIDLFHTRFPFSATLTCATITFQAGISEYGFPTDFIQVYRNGIYFTGNDSGRVRQDSLDAWINYVGQSVSIQRQGQPSRFVVFGPSIFKVFPTPDRSYTAEIWYYALPPVLGQSDIPAFPSDQILIECLHYRQREWLQMAPPGSGQAFAYSAIADLQKQGITNEPEPTDIELDPNVFRRNVGDSRTGWMGDAIVP